MMRKKNENEINILNCKHFQPWGHLPHTPGHTHGQHLGRHTHTLAHAHVQQGGCQFHHPDPPLTTHGTHDQGIPSVPPD